MSKLTEESRQVARVFFKRYDYSDDGTLRGNELLDALCMFGLNLDDNGVQFVRQAFDVDGDGDIQLDELVDHLEELIEYSVNGKQLEDAFKKFDTSGDGKISSRELKKVLKQPGPNCLSEEEASELVLEMLSKYDTDNDKYFSYKEFVAMMKGEENAEENGCHTREVSKLVFEK